MEVELQEQKYWCWAAVAASIGNFLNPTRRLTQCEVADRVLHCPKGPVNPQVKCATTPCELNVPFELDDALKAIGHLDRFQPDYALSFSEIKEVINRQLPIAARVKWYSGGAHFVVIDGYIQLKSGLRFVSVEDPWYDVPEFQTYEELLDDYVYDGYWQDSYLVRR